MFNDFFIFILGFIGHVVPFKILKMFNNSSKIRLQHLYKEDLDGRKILLEGYNAKIQKNNRS